MIFQDNDTLTEGIRSRFGSNLFSTSELAHAFKTTSHWAYSRIRRLRDAGFVELVQCGSMHLFNIWRVK